MAAERQIAAATAATAAPLCALIENKPASVEGETEDWPLLIPGAERPSSTHLRGVPPPLLPLPLDPCKERAREKREGGREREGERGLFIAHMKHIKKHMENLTGEFF